MATWQVRMATTEDVPEILRMKTDLAVFEKQPESRVKLTEEEIRRDGFGETPWFSCLIAEEVNPSEEKNCSLPRKKAVGYALFFNIYSTWDGRSLYLQDLYVDSAFRGKGIGKELLRQVAQIAVEKGCARVDWGVLYWNKIARDFYDKLGAVCLDEWRQYCLMGQGLLEFASKELL
ncbi:thialysine N-epsilon-acetyltransferase-like [Pocillopora verrucosa]|uniref:thialysine N-epsilon-acetyltransferase-like n=1 Tax=Pocillopora verrucosa TaxID=203993 RepID=UPI0033402EB2